jgi:alpha/beta hydrolase fold.
MAMNFDNDIRGALPVISAPTLVIHRSDDPILERARAVALAELIPGARLSVIDGAAHAVNVEHAREFNALVLEFLRSSRAARAAF